MCWTLKKKIDIIDYHLSSSYDSYPNPPKLGDFIHPWIGMPGPNRPPARLNSKRRTKAEAWYAACWNGMLNYCILLYSLSQWTLKKKFELFFSLLNMESPKVQKVSHWLSKYRHINFTNAVIKNYISMQLFPHFYQNGVWIYHFVPRDPFMAHPTQTENGGFTMEPK